LIRTLIASAPDHQRDALAAALRSSDIRVGVIACPLRHLIEALPEQPFNAVLVSVALPGADRATRARWRALVSAAKPAPVLAIVHGPSDERLVDLLSAGVVGAVMSSRPEHAAAAIEAALAGHLAIPRESTALLLATVVRQEQLIFGDGPTSQLTTRERQVFRLMQEHRTTNDIALELGVAPVTVRTHVSAIMRKLSVGDRSAAVELGADEGIRSPGR
jgi:DNA-binding NarL/FixJ family response regulator